jgi:hypothetical protein
MSYVIWVYGYMGMGFIAHTHIHTYTHTRYTYLRESGATLMCTVTSQPALHMSLMQSSTLCIVYSI